MGCLTAQGRDFQAGATEVVVGHLGGSHLVLEGRSIRDLALWVFFFFCWGRSRKMSGCLTIWREKRRSNSGEKMPSLSLSFFPLSCHHTTTLPLLVKSSSFYTFPQHSTQLHLKNELYNALRHVAQTITKNLLHDFSEAGHIRS